MNDFNAGSLRVAACNALAAVLVALVTAGCNEDAGGAGNRPPVLSGLPTELSLVAGESLQVKPWADDADGDALTFEIDKKPAWTSFDTLTGILSGTPTDADAGTYDGIRISVSDGKSVTMGPTFRLVVAASPSAPEPTAVDPPPADDPPPASDSPPDAPSPTNNFAPTASGCSSTSAPPVISGWPTFSLIEGESYSFKPTASDPNCDTLTFSIAGKPAWASFSTHDGSLTGTPPSGTAGTYPGIVISVSDGTFSTSLASFSITVYVNHPPVLSGTPPGRVVGGQLYSFTPGVFDGDGQTLRFSAANVPTWANFDSATGRLAGTPTDAQAGTYAGISISVTDGLLSDSIGPFSITVESGNRAPTISGQPASSVIAGQTYAFTPIASDADADRLTFAVANRPSWASFDTASGRLSGIPTEAAAGEYAGITISVSDGKASTSLAAFSIVVNVANRAPAISGTPVTTVAAGQTYRFVPRATDPDGDTLSFRVANKPAWAAFDAATGELSGTPGSGSAGSYSNVQISVSDGQLVATLPAFSITVQQASTGSATLSWQPPTQRTDGSPLSDLAGYRILYGTSLGNYSNRVTLYNPGLTSYVVDNLSQGTWYFVMTAFDTTGAESDYSGAGSKTIQ